MATSKKKSFVQHELEDVGIYRRTDATRGAHVHVSLMRNGKLYQKYFVDAKCGGPTEALRLARAWRDRVAVQNPALALADFCAIVRSTNTSGIAGVSRVDKGSVSAKGVFVSRPYWCARLAVVDGKIRLKSFSVRKFGEEQARANAVQTRTDALRELGTLAFRARKAPRLVSQPEDFADLDVVLHAPAKRRLLRQQEHNERQKMARAKVLELEARRRQKDEEALNAPTNSTGIPYIGRYVTSAHRGSWCVSMIHEGKRYRKTFSDAKLGGEKSALLAAKAWRDEIFSGFERKKKIDTVTRPHVRNTSGATGVFKSRHVSKSRAFEYWVAKAPFTKGLPSQTKKFSITKYGDTLAYSMAVAARESFVASLDDELTLRHRTGRKLARDIALKSDSGVIPSGQKRSLLQLAK